MATQTDAQLQKKKTKTTKTARIGGVVASALVFVWGIGMTLTSPAGPLCLKPPVHQLQHFALGVLTLVSAGAISVFLSKSRTGLAIGIIAAIVGIIFAGIAPGMPLFVAPPNHTIAMLAAGGFTALLGLAGLGISLSQS